MARPEEAELRRLLCRTLWPGAERSELRAAYAALRSEDLSRMVALADASTLLPGWYLGARDAGVLDLLPRDLAAALKAAWQLNRTRNQRLVAEAGALSDHLARIGCPTVFLKGVGHVLAGTHGDPGARLTSDLDVLVPADRIAEATEHLLALGYRFADGRDHDLWYRLQTVHHIPPMVRDGGLAQVELHTQFLANRPDFPPAAEVLAAAQPAALRPDLKVPAPRHAAQMAMAHSMLRPRVGLARPLKLKDMWDLLAMIDCCEVTATDLARDFRAAGHGTAFDAFVHLIQSLFGPTACADHTPGLRGRLRGTVDGYLWQSPGWLRRADLMLRQGAPVLRPLLAPGLLVRHLTAITTDRRYRRAWRLDRR